MADRMTPSQRHNCMAAIRGKDTKPEILVRRFLFSKGLRFRKHVRSLPGTPDIVLPKYKAVVFVNGCFWHGHPGCIHNRLPQTNSGFWEAKITRNRQRDAQTELELNRLGWRVLRIWECELKPKDKALSTLLSLYDNIVLPPEIPLETTSEPTFPAKTLPPVAYSQPDEATDQLSIAAEPPEPYS
ncbi:MAG: very short patch repair endonuclease [Muribaculaceae bacterium]|nr:very short patch repair endonuclease [Muribaculaceae bacterium]